MEKRLLIHRIGIGGWEHEVFDQCLYPQPRMHSTERLKYYAQFFDTVEVRQTFWDDSLNAGDARQWIDAVAESRRFVFNVKLHSAFTHKKEIRPGMTTRMRSLLQEFAKNDRLGALVAQFPFSFTNTGGNRYHLAKLSEIFRGFPVHVELRHASWDQPSLLSFLGEHSLHPVSSDLPRIKQCMPFITGNVGDNAYLRLHGRNEKGWLLNSMDLRYDYLYNAKELRELERRINAFSGRGLQVTIICNNTTGGKAVANAFELTAALRKSKTVLVAPSALRAFPHLNTISGSFRLGESLLDENNLREAV
jgi:uncharacterized protein YecE (DUF72 family)